MYVFAPKYVRISINVRTYLSTSTYVFWKLYTFNSKDTHRQQVRETPQGG